jgi:hypothetical protein
MRVVEKGLDQLTVDGDGLTRVQLLSVLDKEISMSVWAEETAKCEASTLVF